MLRCRSGSGSGNGLGSHQTGVRRIISFDNIPAAPADHRPQVLWVGATRHERSVQSAFASWGAALTVANLAQATVAVRRTPFQLVMVSEPSNHLDTIAFIHQMRQTAPNRFAPVIGLTGDTEVARQFRAASANDIVERHPSLRSLARLCWYWLPVAAERSI
jgi:PleD family two-component response regulator